MRKSNLLFTALLSGCFLIGTQAFALDRHCEEKVRKAEEKVHEAERKHGEHSRQAEKARHDLERERASCGEHH
jgi:hypothetical protein